MTTGKPNDQTIFRIASIERPFSVLGNAMLQDERISLEARGFLACILSRPATWKMHMRWVMEHHKIGRDKAYRIVAELEKHGYCIREQHRLPGGGWAPISYVFTDCPDLYAAQNSNSPKSKKEPLPGFQEAVKKPGKSKAENSAPPLPENPYPDNPYPEKPETIEKTLKVENNEREKTTNVRRANSSGEFATTTPNAGNSGKRKGKAQAEMPLSDTKTADAKSAQVGEQQDFERLCFDAYRSMAARCGLKSPDYLTQPRRAAMRAIFGTFGRDSWWPALAFVEGSKFLRGENNLNWKLEFDRFLDEKTYLQVAERSYGRQDGDNVVPLANLSKIKREEWASHIWAWEQKGRTQWPQKWGPAPGQPGCAVPADLLPADMRTGVA